ncbi:644_t:CDS:2, partial [Racocetra persica]
DIDATTVAPTAPTIITDSSTNSSSEKQIETTECLTQRAPLTLNNLNETVSRNNVLDWLMNVVEPTRSSSSLSCKGRDIIRPPIPPNEDSPTQPPQEVAYNLRHKYKRSKWIDSELKALEKGMTKYTDERLIWVHILKDEKYGPKLRNRSATDLKDKARNEKKRRAREGRSIGVFHIATG